MQPSWVVPFGVPCVQSSSADDEAATTVMAATRRTLIKLIIDPRQWQRQRQRNLEQFISHLELCPLSLPSVSLVWHGTGELIASTTPLPTIMYSSDVTHDSNQGMCLASMRRYVYRFFIFIFSTETFLGFRLSYCVRNKAQK